MPRRAELTVLTGARDLAQHVLVDIALGVAVRHRDLRDEVDDLREERRGGDDEGGVLHVLPIVAPLATKAAEEREHVVAHDLVHLLGLEMPEPAPPQVLVRPATLVFAIREDRPLHRFLGGGRLCLGQRLQLVQAAEEEEVGDLLNDLEGVGDPARPEGIPHLVDLALQRSRHHF